MDATKKVVVTLTVDVDVTNEQLHEALCKILHEGYAVDDAQYTGIPAGWLTDIGDVRDAN